MFSGEVGLQSDKICGTILKIDPEVEIRGLAEQAKVSMFLDIF